MRELFRFVHWPSWLLFWASLVLLRWQIVEEVGIGFGDAWARGLGLGFHSDLVAALIPTVIGWLAWGATGLSRRIGYPAGAMAVWFATAGNTLYFSHFGVSLDWWVVRYHLGDLADVRGNAAQLANVAPVVISLLLALAALAVFLWRETQAARKRQKLPASLAGGWKNGAGEEGFLWGTVLPFLQTRLMGTVRATGILFLFLLLQQSPRAVHILSIGHPVNSHILQLWFKQIFYAKPFSGLEQEIGRAYGRKLQAGRQQNPGLVLARYRDFKASDWPALRKIARANGARQTAKKARPLRGTVIGQETSIKKPAASGEVSGDSGTGPPGQAAGEDDEPAWPLLREFNPTPERTRGLRRALGLPEEGPINVILLLVEGFRWYEVNHPYAGPRIFPRVRRLLRNHGIAFSQAYSSSATAGQTVRGSFSTYCSFLPNLRGPATYIAYSTIRIRCLPELMKENGYETLWFNSHRKNAHNKDFFEGNNGVDHFYDREFFESRGVTERMGEWGYGDQSVLRESLKKIREWARGEKPVYAQLLTVSTHLPIVAAPGVKFDDEFEAYLRENIKYRNFMSMFRYVDDAVGDFVEGLFASEMGANTVVFLLGDHSNGEPPVKRLAMDWLQQFDAQFRIPLVVLTKSMPKPETRRRLVHQMDVVPTAARIAGIRGQVTWLGKGLFQPGNEGTPWVYAHGKTLYWRTQNLGCYGRKCYDLTNYGQSNQSKPPRVRPPQKLKNFFSAVVEAVGLAIGQNRISPIN